MSLPGAPSPSSSPSSFPSSSALSLPPCLPLHVNTARNRATGDASVTLLPEGAGVPSSSLVGPACTDGEIYTATPVKKMWVLVKRPVTVTNDVPLDREPLTEEGADVGEDEDDDDDGNGNDDNFERIDSRDEEDIEEEDGYSPSNTTQGQGQDRDRSGRSSLSPMGVFKAVRDTKVRNTPHHILLCSALFA